MRKTWGNLFFKFTTYFVLTIAGFYMVSAYQGAVLATSVGGVGVKPAGLNEEYPPQGNWFVYEVDAKEVSVIEDSVLLVNSRDEEVTVKLEAVDAIVPVNGGFALLDSKHENLSLGSWITLEENIVKVPPKTNMVVPFTINIPENPEVGDHIGGIVVMQLKDDYDAVLKSGGTSVNIRTRVASRMYLTITGDIVRGFELEKRYMKGAGKDIRFGFKIKNSGNIRNKLAFDAHIYSLFGLFEKLEGLAIGEIFPGKTLSKEVVWPGKERPLFGPYIAFMKIYDTYEPMNKDSEIAPTPDPIQTWAITFFIPYTQVIIIVILLFLAWFLRQFIIWRKMVILTRQPVVIYRVKKGDHLMDVAEDYDADWKLVARINNIKAPYNIRNVKELHIPDARGTRRDIPVVSFWKHISTPFAGFINKLKNIRKIKPKTDEQIIVIEQGDKIKDIEKFTGLAWDEILAYNKLRATFRLRAGQELIIPKKVDKKATKKRSSRKKK